MPDLAELEASRGEFSFQRRYARGGAAVEQCRPVVRLDDVAADAPRRTAVQEVDRGRAVMG